MCLVVYGWCGVVVVVLRGLLYEGCIYFCCSYGVGDGFVGWWFGVGVGF